MTTDTSATERAQDAASTAKDEGKHVAGVASEEARGVASEARDQARNLAGEAMTQVQDQVGTQTRDQRDKLVSTLGTLGDDLERMASQSDSGLATELARQVADRARSISSRLDGREPEELLEDVRTFARQRPGTFLLGALVAGVVVGRLARGARDGVMAAAAEDSGTGTAGMTTLGGQTGYVDPTPVSVATPPTTQSPITPASPAAPSTSPMGSGLGDDLAGNESGYAGKGGLSGGTS